MWYVLVFFGGLGPLFINYEDNEILTWRQINPFAAERQPTFTGHFHGAITHNQHLFGNFFPLMELENTHNFKIMSVCVVPLTLWWALLCHVGWFKSWWMSQISVVLTVQLPWWAAEPCFVMICFLWFCSSPGSHGRTLALLQVLGQ